MESLQVGGGLEGPFDQAFWSLSSISCNVFEMYVKLRRYFSTAHKITVTEITGNEEVDGVGSRFSESLHKNRCSTVHTVEPRHPLSLLEICRLRGDSKLGCPFMSPLADLQSTCFGGLGGNWTVIK